jgi:uncharacterized protein
MKQLSIMILTLYQAALSPVLKQAFGITASCRFSPTCSLYTQRMIRQHGVLKGIRLGLRQLLACHPFTNYEYI